MSDDDLTHLQADLDAAIARADSYLDLIHQAISHHLAEHPGCGHYRTVTTHDHAV